ncbi:MAG: sugar ABC transporter permease [Thermotaleaceae bacterium]
MEIAKNKMGSQAEVIMPKGKEPKRINWKKIVFIISMLGWPLLNWFVFTLYMNIQTFLYSFQRLNKFTGKMRFAGLENYLELFQKISNNTASYGVAFRNTFLWLGLNVLVIVPISLIVAYVLSKKIPLYRFFNTVLFIPNIISIVILTMVWSFMWAPNQGIVNGLLDLLGMVQYKRIWLGDHRTALGVVFLYCVWAGIGWNNLILGGAIAKIPKEILESAQLDGASNWQEFIHIIIPNVWPTISTVTIIGATAAFRVFLHPKLLTNGEYGTSNIALKVVDEVLGEGNYGLASAAGITMAILGFITVYMIKAYLDRMEKKWS